MPEPPVSLGLIQTAWEAAAAEGISAQLVCAVVEQESAWNTFAVRYEPGFLSKYVAPQYTQGKLSATEAYTRSMSWGLMQLMGEVARELGFDGPWLTELTDPKIGLLFGCKKLKSCLTKAKDDEAKALLIWNGGANANYPAETLARKGNYATDR